MHQTLTLTKAFECAFLELLEFLYTQFLASPTLLASLHLIEPLHWKQFEDDVDVGHNKCNSNGTGTLRQRQQDFYVYTAVC